MLELKTYTKAELVEIFGTEDTQGLKRKLTRYGIVFQTNGRGNRLTFDIKEVPDPFKLFCIDELGYDGRTDFRKLREFLYCYINDDEFRAMPDEVKEHRMGDNGTPVSRQTIANYTSKLVGLDLIDRNTGEYIYYFAYKDGNYYLIGYDDRMKKMVNYRVDRMKEVDLTGEPRCSEEEFKALNIEAYLQEHFGMFEGKRDHVTIRAVNRLLDTFVDRFGTRGVVYTKYDDKHFTVVVPVAISNQFFGWLCGLGDKVKILSPSPVVEEFKEYLDKMRGMYE